MKSSRSFAGCVALAAIILQASCCAAELTSPAPAPADWPQWRGPNRDGVAPSGPKLLDAWPKGGPPILWKSDVIPCKNVPDQDHYHKEVRSGGAGSPVVAGGRVFVYADVTDRYVVTSKMLDEWGWMDGVSDELATKIEEARNKAGSRKGADLDKYISDFIATLDAAQAQKFGDHIRKRIKLGVGESAAGWWGMTTLVGAGAQDKEYSSYGEWEKINYKGKSFGYGSLVNGHGDGGSGGNYISGAVSRECKHTDTVFCLDAATGKTLWKTEFTGHGENDGFSTPASATPAISNDKCYVAGSAGIYCLSVSDGKVIWKTKAQFTHSSPLVANGMVYVLFNQPDGLMAFNAETGQVAWRQPKLWNLFSSPALWTGKDGKSALVCYAFGAGASLVDPKTGDILCPLPDSGPAPWAQFSSPVVSGDTVVIPCGNKLTGFKIDYPKAEKIWSLKDVTGGRGTSPVVYQGYAYLFSQAWSECVDIKTGERKWKGKGGLCYETPSPVIADGKVYTHEGENRNTMSMLKASPDIHDAILAEMPNLSCIFCSPAIAGGKMYLRSWNNVICYDIAQHGPYVDKTIVTKDKVTFVFKQTGGGLVTKEPSSGLKDIVITDATGTAKPAQATITGDTITVDIKDVPVPFGISCGATNSLAGKDGQPVPAFGWNETRVLTFRKCVDRSIELASNLPLNQTWNTAAMYTVAGATVTNARISGKSVTLTTDKTWKSGDSITVTYPCFQVEQGESRLEKLVFTVIEIQRAAARFVKTDETTAGSWKGTYGTDGAVLAGEPAATLKCGTVTIKKHDNYTFAGSTADARALQKSADAKDRIAACWFSGEPFDIDVELTDGKEHQVALYCLDWDGKDARAMTVEVQDPFTNTVLDKQTIEKYSKGKYVVWNIKGQVTFHIVNTGPMNAVVSGLYFDPPAPDK